MRQRVVPLLVPPLRKSQPEDVGSYETKTRGMAVLTTPLLNKGTAFTAEEREAWASTACFRPSSARWRLRSPPPTPNTSGCRMRWARTSI